MLHLSPAPGVIPGRVALAATLALHALVLLALLSYAPARKALLEAVPIVVNLLAPPKPEPRIEPPEPPRPKPVARIPLPIAQPLPVLTAPAETPTPAPIAPQPPAPAVAPPLAAPPAPVVAPPASVAVTPPVFNAAYLHNPAPAYPPVSRRLGEEGRVVLRVLVNPSGTADDVQVRSSSGSARLDEAARDTVRRWKFVPAKRGVEAVPAWVLIPISFRLES